MLLDGDMYVVSEGQLAVVNCEVIHYLVKQKENDISKALFISNSYLSYCFKKTIGVTPMEYANYLRCSIAFHCIATGHYPIKEAAYRCGFNNLSYFSRVFKKIIGILPSEVVIENN